MSVWPRVGLVMIVRDEEAVIERALRSALPWIQAYLIVDTGSTDSTKDIITRVMSERPDISGCIVDRPWVNFGHNRTEALRLCDGKMEWAIMLDADDNLVGEPPSRDVWDKLTIDAYAMRIHHDQIQHVRLQIFRVDANWAYKGVIHEQPYCITTEKPTICILPSSAHMQTRCEGSRSRDPQKYQKDAAILETEWMREPLNGRTLFYLAQSYRDANTPRMAEHYYRKLVDLSGGYGITVQEYYMAFVNLIDLVTDSDEVIRMTWRALDCQPNRLEAPFTFLHRWRTEKRPITQQVYAIGTVVTNRTVNALWPYINPMVYEWAYDDEFAAVAHTTGHYQVALDATTRVILNGPTTEVREGAIKNVAVIKRALGGNSSI